MSAEVCSHWSSTQQTKDDKGEHYKILLLLLFCSTSNDPANHINKKQLQWIHLTWLLGDQLQLKILGGKHVATTKCFHLHTCRDILNFFCVWFFSLWYARSLTQAGMHRSYTNTFRNLVIKSGPKQKELLQKSGFFSLKPWRQHTTELPNICVQLLQCQSLHLVLPPLQLVVWKLGNTDRWHKSDFNCPLVLLR